MKKLLTLLLVLITCSVSAIDMGPYDTGAARKSDLNLKLDLDGGNAPTTIPLNNASFTGDIDVAGDVGAATVNGVAPLTAAEKTQALVGSSTVDFDAQTIGVTPDPALGDSQGITVKSATSTSSIVVWLENDIGSFTRIMKTRSAAAAPSAGGTVIYHDNDPMVQIKGNGQIKLFVVSTYADNAAALSGGLVAGDIYRTSTGVLMIVY